MIWTVALVWYSLWWASLAHLAIRWEKLVLSDLVLAVLFAPAIPLIILADAGFELGDIEIWKRK